MGEKKTYSIKEYTQKKLMNGGSYLFLMLFQQHVLKQNISDNRTFSEWDELLDDFGTQPTKDVIDRYDPFA